MSRAGRSLPVLLVAALAVPALLEARVRRVPQDYAMIQLAVASARDGDEVEVDDGFYFERDIIVDKRIAIRSRNLFGAVIYGSPDAGAAIFIVRAEAEISGFILKNSFFGILQRGSPDVAWTGHDLALFNFYFGVAIDDREFNVGSARLSDLIIGGCTHGIATNDAGRVEVLRAFVSSTEVAFAGSDHLSFRVEDAVVWNCAAAAQQDPTPCRPPGTNRVELGKRILLIKAGDPPAKQFTLVRALNALFRDEDSAPGLRLERRRRREGLLSVMLGEYFLKSGSARDAAAHFEAALAEAKVLGLEEIQWRAVLGLAQAREKAGDIPAAVARYKEAIALIERISIGLPLRTFRSGFRLDKIGIYEKLIAHLAALHRARPAEGFGREAFLFAEKSKARGFLASLLGAGESLPSGGDAALREEERRNNLEIARLQVGLQADELAPGRRHALLQRLALAETERRNFLIRIRRRDPRDIRFQYWDASDAQAVGRTLLDDRTALLEYVIGEEGSTAFLLTRDGLQLAALPPEREIRPLVDNYLKYLTLRDAAGFKGWTGGRRLRELLLAPFEERLRRGITGLIIIPDGPLHYLPFEALVDRDRERFLVEDYDVRYGASASCLIKLLERPAPARYAKDFLGVANPYPMKASGLSEEEELKFPGLAYAEKEVRRLERRFEPSRRTLLLGAAARESALKSLDLSAYRIIHIVAHGFFDDRNWWRSALLLLRDKDGKEDGFLQPNDIYALTLDPELLVLSGCGTGTGTLEKGEGVNGLSYAFFYAGARAILLSLWGVDDKATASFMDSFYGYWKAGKSKTEALRLAKIDALRGPSKNPFAWAPFVLLGN